VTNIDQNLPTDISAAVSRALAEDIGSGDLTAALVPAGQRAQATVIIRDDAVICGIPWFDEVFKQLSADINIDWQVAEGSSTRAGTVLCELQGPARELLTGERTALNFLQTLSATATAAHEFATAIADTGAIILDTRKTLPGLRVAQKYAVRTGGAANHRTGLYDGILIKENHIAAAGGIANAVRTALSQAGDALVEVEVENLTEAREAIAAGAHRLLVDNFSLADMREAVTLRDSADTGVTLEASGGIDLKTVHGIAATGVDYISIGALTKDIQAVDLSMRFTMIAD
jgi:nicotinate-nucleotide pyrophosphorylase (carboxylating)